MVAAFHERFTTNKIILQPLFTTAPLKEYRFPGSTCKVGVAEQFREASFVRQTCPGVGTHWLQVRSSISAFKMNCAPSSAFHPLSLSLSLFSSLILLFTLTPFSLSLSLSLSTLLSSFDRL